MVSQNRRALRCALCCFLRDFDDMSGGEGASAVGWGGMGWFAVFVFVCSCSGGKRGERGGGGFFGTAALLLKRLRGIRCKLLCQLWVGVVRSILLVCGCFVSMHLAG